MAYYGYQPEQTKAQIRSTRGETIDLALPVSCLVGELRNFLIDEYNYDPNTRLLYNGHVADDNSYVCDYPFGSLMIATPADMQMHRQPLPPRQSQQQQQHQQYQQRLQEPVRTSPSTSPRPNSGNLRKAKQAEPMTNAAANGNNNAGRRTNPADGNSPDANKKSKNTGRVIKHPPKRSPRKPPRSTSAESNGSYGGNGEPAPPAPVDASPPPAMARERTSPSNNNNNHNNMGSGRAQANRMNSGRSPNSTGTPMAQQDAGEAAITTTASASPAAAAPSQQQQQQQFSPPPPPPPPPPPQPSQPAMTPEVTTAASPAGTNTTNKQSAAEAEEEEHNHRLRLRFTVECHIPSLNRLVHVPMNGESSVADLVLAVVAQVPELGGQAKVVFRGKVLPQTQQAKLFDFGMRADTRVFIASGEYSNPETITLLEIEKDTAEIEEAMRTNLSDLQRKGYYEELMRILFRTDGLQSLEGEWRQRRRDAVKRITALQDALGVEVKTS
jgi:hypothetical protein